MPGPGEFNFIFELGFYSRDAASNGVSSGSEPPAEVVSGQW